MSDPEVRAPARRRQFSAAYKLAMLEEAGRANDSGAIGALLRREGLYSSHLSTWRRERETGALAALGRTRGRKATFTPEQKRLAALQGENAKRKRELEPAQTDPQPAHLPERRSCGEGVVSGHRAGVTQLEADPSLEASAANLPNPVRKRPRPGLSVAVK